MGPMSTIEKGAVNSVLTHKMLPFSLGAMILMSFTKVLTTWLSKPATLMKILRSALILT